MMKKILFLSINMGGYYDSIKDRLLENGYEVTFFDEATKIKKNKLKHSERIIRLLSKEFKMKFFKEKFTKIEKRIYSESLKKLDDEYDCIFDLGSRTELTCLELLRKKIKGKYILFIWDDIDYHYRSRNLMYKFDKTYTYSLTDANKYKLIFRPSFYNKEFLYNNEKKDIDVFYVGSIREAYRVKVIEKIDEILVGYNNSLNLSGKLKFKHILDKNRYQKYLLDKAIPMKELCNYYKRSKVLLDIAFKEQIGLGLRPIEAIGAKCKLITTNPNVKYSESLNCNNYKNVYYQIENMGHVIPSANDIYNKKHPSLGNPSNDIETDAVIIDYFNNIIKFNKKKNTL